MSAARRRGSAESSERYWIGYVLGPDVGGTGHPRRRVAIPESWLEDLATEPPSGPDMRHVQANAITHAIMSDEFLHELYNGPKKP